MRPVATSAAESPVRLKILPIEAMSTSDRPPIEAMSSSLRSGPSVNVGVLKSGGETAPKDAPGLKARLDSVLVQYKILGGASTAALKLWGFD